IGGTASAVAQAAASGLCSIRDVGGGQLANVCHVGGYEMPAFIFYASLAIFILFAVASTGLFRQCTRVAQNLADLAKRLEHFRKSGKPVGSDQLEEIRKLMGRDQIVAHTWQQFEDTLLHFPEEEEVYSTQSAEAIFSRAVVIEENVQSSFFAAIPGILTGLGLLMTFVAILDGLSHVSVSANMDVQGIGGLINGLSGKFVSSIVAVSCAVMFVFVERIAYSRPNAAHRAFLSQLSSLFRRKTAEQLLFQLVHKMKRG
ncbi:MAG: hypothetical protein ACXWPM_03345, partial [Bdellovibrionota bacterium]